MKPVSVTGCEAAGRWTFLLGKITRSHADIDIVTWRRHAPRVRALLVARGYRSVASKPPHLAFRKRGQDVGVVFVERRNGRVVGLPEDWGWLPEALSESPARLGDLACRVVAPEQLLREKLAYRRNTGRPLRSKDRASIRVLRALLRRRG